MYTLLELNNDIFKIMSCKEKASDIFFSFFFCTRPISDTLMKNRRRNEVNSYHEYEEVESLSSSHFDNSNNNQAYENSEDNFTADRCYINAACPPLYIDLDHNTRTDIRGYDEFV